MSTDVSSSLQIPDPAVSGPSRQHASTRAASISVQPNSASSQPPSSRKTRASHAVVSPSEQQRQQQMADSQTGYHDAHSHPAAVAYAAAHPRRQIPKFGPYLLLQTLGEGEFGKVKLGLHSLWGEEVAVKLIRRGNIDSTARMSKVEREIEVLRTLKHPNIVRLYEVIETDKYIGIIIEYASGGELFDHILAHRYLKERDAAKLFSQLISGVWYIHQKKIVHRDLKLENLLLDRHRNVIITDFGFANRFEHRSDDLMQTSCGSPCYAAPELVISEGLYVGSAVDIWSCGVILYAMLAGYLPFDDDPANPDGDNINLLYKYIVNTPLSFPEYISTEARDLLSMMLVPDPTRRADLSSVMAHKWLAPYAHIFQRGVDELEQAALEQHQMKRLAYQRQMKQAAAQAKVSRTQSTKSVDVFGGKSRAGQQGIAQPDFLYETSVEQSNYVPPAAARKHHPVDVPLDDDPFSPSLSQAVSPLDDVTAEGDVRGGPRAKRSKDDGGSRTRKVSAPTSEPKKKGGFRHTIQVEYDDAQQETQQPSGLSPPRRASSKRREQEDVQMANADGRGVRERAGSQTSPSTSSPVRERGKTARRPSQSSAKPLPEPPASPFVAARDAAATSPGAGAELGSAEPGQDFAISTDSQSSKHSKHRKGLSMDRIGLGKIFGTTPATDQLNGAGSSDKSEGPSPFVGEHDKEKRPATLEPLPGNVTPKASSKNSLLSPGGDSQKNSRRNTLTVMVEPFRSRKSKNKNAAADTPSKDRTREKLSKPPPQSTSAATKAGASNVTPAFSNASNTDFGLGAGISASTSKARKVMQWFRSRSKGRDLSDLDDSMLPISGDEAQPRDATPTQAHFARADVEDAQGPPVQVLVTPTSPDLARPTHPQRTASATTDTSLTTKSLANRVRRSVGLGAPSPPPPKGLMRVHHGAVDSKNLTTRPPEEVMRHVREVLVEMGLQIFQESDYKFRCERPKRKKTGAGIMQGVNSPSGSGGVAAINVSGSAASNGVDKRGLPVPSSQTFGVTGGMLKGLLMRRQSSQVSANSGIEDEPGASPVSTSAVSNEPAHEPIYGSAMIDVWDEVRFSVELTRIDRLTDMFSLDIRRLKGNLRSYKFLYDTIREFQGELISGDREISGAWPIKSETVP